MFWVALGLPKKTTLDLANKTEKTAFSVQASGQVATAMQLQCNCNATAMQLQCNCNATAMQLQCNCNATAMQLQCNCKVTTMQQ